MNFSYIHINSKDRLQGSNSSTDFNISIGQALYLDEIQLDAVQIPYTYWNVNTSTNTLVVNWNSTNYTLTITPGNYTLSELQQALNTAVQTINSNITATLNNNTWMFTFSFANASPATGSLILSKSTINRLIGFPTSTDTSSASSITSTTVALMNDQAFIFITMNIGDNIISTAGHKYTFYVPVNVNGGDVISYQTNLDKNQCIKVGQPIKYFQFNIRLIDNFGNLLDLNGSDWSMTVRIYFKDSSC